MIHHSTSTPPPSVPASTVHPVSNFWAAVPESRRSALLRRHLNRALEVVNEYSLPLPDTLVRFELMVMLAVDAELLFFNAALYEPSQEDRNHFFADFLRRTLQPYAEIDIPHF